MGKESDKSLNRPRAPSISIMAGRSVGEHESIELSNWCLKIVLSRSVENYYKMCNTK